MVKHDCSYFNNGFRIYLGVIFLAVFFAISQTALSAQGSTNLLPVPDSQFDEMQMDMPAIRALAPLKWRMTPIVVDVGIAEKETETRNLQLMVFRNFSRAFRESELRNCYSLNPEDAIPIEVNIKAQFGNKTSGDKIFDALVEKRIVVDFEITMVNSSTKEILLIIRDQERGDGSVRKSGFGMITKNELFERAVKKVTRKVIKALPPLFKQHCDDSKD